MEVRAHPRSRGENDNQVPSKEVQSGSSPLTRGKQQGRRRQRHVAGLIPAHAGKTPESPPRAGGPWAHPRSRGENAPMVSVLPFSQGSSPLTRGKPPSRRVQRRRQGLIPAHAGKTIGLGPFGVGHRAHPRSRGENRRPRGPRGSDRGSSPLTRGKPTQLGWWGLSLGLIPAHAGKTTASPRRTANPQAHPRSRGENELDRRDRTRIRGSSPLTRGKRGVEPLLHERRGLIPAHAGKTSSAPTPPTPRPAHPRSRGENLPDEIATCQAGGSSPLTRGKRAVLRLDAIRVRLIPAHAGKTGSSHSWARGAWAHPRSRGENAGAVPAGGRSSGSSPLTRGKPARRSARLFAHRLIPAHAGKTRENKRMIDDDAAHPRSRGENLRTTRPCFRQVGSSPLTRGKRPSAWPR